MNRVFRKHGKIILAVLGVILMIIFVLPSISRSGPTDSPLGMLDGKRVSTADLNGASSDINILKNYFGLNVDALLDDREPSLHWYLLLKDASRYGFSNVQAPPEQVNEQLLRVNTAERLNKELAENSVDRRQLQAAFSHYEAILQYLTFLSDLPRPVSEVELVGDKLLAKAQLAYVTIDGTEGWESMPAPTDDQIKKQFEAYKGIVRTVSLPDQPMPPLPAEVDGHHFPFGYKYPDRVAVEWLTFSHDAIAAQMKPDRQDYEDAYKYYREHESEFRNTTAPAAVVSTQPSTRPFSDVQEELVKRQVEQRIGRQLGRITDRVRNAASDPWRNQTVDARGYRESLPQAQWVSYQKIADDISKNRDFDGFKPEYHATEGLLGEEALAQLPGIGKSFYRPNGQNEPYPFALLATRVHELAELSPKDPLSRLFLQVGAEGPVVEDSAGNLYIYRVTRVEKSHEPASLDEVRGQVVDDLKKEAAYQRAESRAKDLATAARNADLLSLAQQQKLQGEKTGEITRLQQNMPQELAHIRNFIDTAFSLVNGSPASRPAATQPTTQATTLPVSERRSTVLANDDSLKVYVLQLLSVAPAQPSEFASEISFERMMQRYGGGEGNYFPLLSPPPEERNIISTKLFTLEALADRLHYKPDHPFSKKES